MEANSNLNSRPVMPLNYDCMLKIFDWLCFKDCMGLAEAYVETQCAADYMYKRKFTKFIYDFEEPIDRVFYHIGPFVRSLTLVLNTFDYTQVHLKKIWDACEQLKSLTLNRFDKRNVKNNPFDGANNVEVLTLDHCTFAYDNEFFDSFTKLKSLNINRCREIDNIAVKKCFEKNEITSFAYNGPFQLYPHLLKLLPKLERLCLHYNTRMTRTSFSNFRELRFLTMHCYDENINEILTELAKTSNLEQLELIDVEVDGEIFDIINSFNKLELLVVHSHECEFSLPKILPPKLKSLKLGGFQISQQQITTLAEQLVQLEEIFLADCIMENNGVLIYDFFGMADLVIEALVTGPI